MGVGPANFIKPLIGNFDWFAISAFVASTAAYTYEYWWTTKWFAFG